MATTLGLKEGDTVEIERNQLQVARCLSESGGVDDIRIQCHLRDAQKILNLPGQISEIRVIKTSGNMVFDAGAVDSIYRSSPFPPPPKAVLSWNRRVYLRWGFYRNNRKCGVFNVEPYILKAPGANEEPLPVDRFTIDDG